MIAKYEVVISTTSYVHTKVLLAASDGLSTRLPLDVLVISAHLPMPTTRSSPNLAL